MKKLFFVSVVFILLALFSTSLVFAQRDDAASREKFQQKLEVQKDRRQSVKERVATKQAALRADHIGRLKEVFSRILLRFNAAISRLEKISDKILTRIDKLEAGDTNVANFEASLAACEAKKTAAQNAVSNAQSQIADIDENSSTVRETVRTSVDSLHAAKRAIRDYHKCLVDVTKSIKATRGREGTNSAR